MGSRSPTAFFGQACGTSDRPLGGVAALGASGLPGGQPKDKGFADAGIPASPAIRFLKTIQ